MMLTPLASILTPLARAWAAILNNLRTEDGDNLATEAGEFLIIEEDE